MANVFATYPLRWQIGLGQGLTTNPVTWTDITSYVRMDLGASWNTGRSNEDDSIASPGTLSCTVDNSGGQFTPGAAGALGDLSKRCPIRVQRYTPSPPGWQTLWAGFVTDIQTGWENGVAARAQISASDRLAFLNRDALPSALDVSFQAVGPNLCWPMDDPAGTWRVRELAGGVGLTRYGNVGLVELGDGAGPGPDEVTVATLTSQSGALSLNQAQLAYRGSVAPPADDMAFAVWVRVPTAPAALTKGDVVYHENVAGTTSIRVWIDEAGTVTGSYLDNATTTTITSSRLVTGGGWHLVVFSVSGGTTNGVQLFLDGVSEGSATRSAAVGSFTGGLTIGATPVLGSVDRFDGQISHPAVFYRQVVQADVDILWDAVHGGMSVDERTSWVADGAGLTGFSATVSATPVALEPQPMLGRSAWDVIIEAAKTIHGVVFCDPASDGAVVLTGQSIRNNAAAALSLDNRDVGSDLAVMHNDEGLVNDVTATQVDGPFSVHRTDASSIADWGRSTLEESLPIADFATLEAWALDVLARKASPGARFQQITVDLQSKQATVNPQLASQVGINDRLTITDLPTDSSPTATVDVFVEGTSDQVSINSWVRSFTTSPAGYFTDVFVLGTDALDGSAVLGF